MLALRGELDVADQHEIIVAGGFTKSAGQHLRRALMIALVEFVEGLDHPARGIDQTFAAGVFADIAEQGVHRRLGLGARWTRLVRTDGGGEEFGRIELGGARFRGFGVGRIQI
jgi:hypothetical protein